LHFDSNEILIRLNDRLLAPNTSATFANAKSALESLAREIFGHRLFTLEYKGAGEGLFEVSIKATAAAMTPSAILAQLHALSA
jgi:hypothetical protein